LQFDTGLADLVRQTLDDVGLGPRYLNLEVTESSIMRNAALAVTVLTDLKKLGIEVSIDDFGTGYSSLGHLKSLPIDVLKIDQSFVRDVTIDNDDASIVVAIVNLARTLGLKVVAEGVETEGQLAYLNLLHCDEWQGYLYSKPVPAEEFTRLLGVAAIA
jgi:EAL domain-containing protein (putative c-di-GMP-specific phosphodiesterase class I)